MKDKTKIALKVQKLVEERAREFKKLRDEYEEKGEMKDYDEAHLLWWWFDTVVPRAKVEVKMDRMEELRETLTSCSNADFAEEYEALHKELRIPLPKEYEPMETE